MTEDLGRYAIIGFILSLRRTLSGHTRFSIVNAIFDDALRADVPHQWEKKEGFECGPNNDCGKPNADKTCYRDTRVGVCYTD